MQMLRGMTQAMSAGAFIMIATLATTVRSTAQQPSGPWMQFAAAEEAGFVSSRLEHARQYADSVRSGAVMAIYRGHVLVAWGDVGRKLELHSVRKNLVHALFGLESAGGRIDLEQTIGDLGIDDREPLTEQEKRARIADLLAARSGVYLSAAYAGAEQDRERPARGSHAPGTHFFYNNWDYNVAGVIYEKLAGKDLYETFKERIAEPLGMEDFEASDGFRVYEPGNSIHPAHTFRMSTRDLARFGLLYLQGGKWNGRQVIGADWVSRGVRPITDFGNGNGYGHLWWTYRAGALGERYPHLDGYDVFYGTGTGGQLLLIVPGADLVVVLRGDTDNGRQVSGRDAWTIADQILGARSGEPVRTPRLSPLQPVALASQAPPRPRPKPAEIGAALRNEYAGEYEIAPQRVARVFLFADRLFMNMPGQGEAELLAISATEFTIMPIPGVRIQFGRDAAGRVTHFDAMLGTQPMRGTKR